MVRVRGVGSLGALAVSLLVAGCGDSAMNGHADGAARGDLSTGVDLGSAADLGSSDDLLVAEDMTPADDLAPAGDLAMATGDLAMATGDAAKGDLAMATGDLAMRPADMAAAGDMAGAQKRRVIVFVWDGLRPDSIDANNTPNAFALRSAGAQFSDNHSTYPTFTMVNAGAFATGAFPGKTGYYGNTIYAPGATGNSAGGTAADFVDPIFTEDYAILSDLDAYYSNQLLLVGTLFQAAHAANLTTAAVGKSGAAFLQDYKRGGYILDEKMVWPYSLVQELQANNFALPKATPFAYPAGMVTLAGNNGDPTAASPTARLADGATTDPTVGVTAPPSSANAYLMGVYLNYILPMKLPDLSVVWLRSPDSTEHSYGPGSAAYVDALKAQDGLLGMLLSQLQALGLSATTDVIVVSDHGHSSVSGPASLFPLRAIATGQIAAVDPNGYSVSGAVRLADLLTRAGFTAFDGNGCAYDPVMSGIKADGSPVYPALTDTTGTLCGGKPYNTPSYKLPMTLPPKAIVVAAVGGSDFLYLPDHDMATVANAVKYLQKREEVATLFVDPRYGDLPGTLPLTTVKAGNAVRNPDVIVGYDFDETQLVRGLPGIEFDGTIFNNRGMHGSFSPRDVHNTLFAGGPDFLTGFTDPLPSANVDVAPTVARLLGLTLPSADGRPLLEALKGGALVSDYTVTPATVAPTAVAAGVTFQKPTDPTGGDVDATPIVFTFNLHTKTLSRSGASYVYFDSAKVSRQPGPTCVSINEVQTGGVTASDEFIELYNGCAQAVDLTGFTIVYRSATGTTDVTVVPSTSLAGAMVPAHGWFVAAQTSWTGMASLADVRYTAALAATGGGLALKNAAGAIVDSVGWGTATNAFVETAVAPAPGPSQSIERLPDGRDRDDNATDFQLGSAPTPHAANK